VLLQVFNDIGARELLDIALVALLAYGVILWMKRAKAGLAMAGILILGSVYLATRELGLQLAAWILQGFFAAFLILLVVLFQRDLRQLFERIAVWSLQRNAGAPSSDETVLTIVEALTTLARHKHGALVVLPGRDPLDRHLEGGVALDGRLSAPLLLSLFDPASAGHDGALIVEGDIATRFAVHLPLSRDFDQLGQRGTRHSAALGLAERTDSLCIVVSEERGDISIARDGALRPVPGAEELESELEQFLKSKRPPHAERRVLWSFLAKNWIEKAAAVGLALGLWVIFVSGSQGVREARMAPVLFDNIPSGFEVTNVEPKEVEVTLSGPRREFYVIDQTDVEVRVDGFLVGLGRRSFRIRLDDVRHPDSLTVVAWNPQTVELTVNRLSPEAQKKPATNPAP
jgi:uncharacterized protein (TIGR00159 family)